MSSSNSGRGKGRSRGYASNAPHAQSEDQESLQQGSMSTRGRGKLRPILPRPATSSSHGLTAGTSSGETSLASTGTSHEDSTRHETTSHNASQAQDVSALLSGVVQGKVLTSIDGNFVNSMINPIRSERTGGGRPDQAAAASNPAASRRGSLGHRGQPQRAASASQSNTAEAFGNVVQSTEQLSLRPIPAFATHDTMVDRPLGVEEAATVPRRKSKTAPERCSHCRGKGLKCSGDQVCGRCFSDFGPTAASKCVYDKERMRPSVNREKEHRGGSNLGPNYLNACDQCRSDKDIRDRDCDRLVGCMFCAKKHQVCTYTPHRGSEPIISSANLRNHLYTARENPRESEDANPRTGTQGLDLESTHHPTTPPVRKSLPKAREKHRDIEEDNSILGVQGPNLEPTQPPRTPVVLPTGGELHMPERPPAWIARRHKDMYYSDWLVALDGKHIPPSHRMLPEKRERVIGFDLRKEEWILKPTHGDIPRGAIGRNSSGNWAYPPDIPEESEAGPGVGRGTTSQIATSSGDSNGQNQAAKVRTALPASRPPQGGRDARQSGQGTRTSSKRRPAGDESKTKGESSKRGKRS